MRRSIAGLSIVAVVISLVFASAAAASSAGYYLDLGASVSLGVQPSPVSGHGAPTSTGYANDLIAQQLALGDDLHLVQMGCPGETTSSFVTGLDRCYHAPDDQLAEAVGFLHDHPDDRTLVTVDVGFDDIVSCLWHRVVDAACLDQRLAAVPGQLAHIVGTLRDAAGPHVLFLGVGAYDPFLADAAQDPAAQSFAEASLDAIGRLNAQLRAGYASAGVPMVEIASLFSGDDRDADAVEASSLVAMAEHTCTMTWMCTAAPNIHPNDAGYRAIAGAIEAHLPRDW